MKRLILHAIIHTTLFTLLFLVLFPYIAGRFDIFLGSFDLGVFRYLGILVVIFGGLLAVWCIVLFVVKGLGTPAPYDPPKKLVISGPYKYMRNPMAVGSIIMLLGYVLLFQSTGIFLYTIIYTIEYHLFIICYEEKKLPRIFGEEYKQYKNRVRRWLPKITCPVRRLQRPNTQASDPPVEGGRQKVVDDTFRMCHSLFISWLMINPHFLSTS